MINEKIKFHIIDFTFFTSQYCVKFTQQFLFSCASTLFCYTPTHFDCSLWFMNSST